MRNLILVVPWLIFSLTCCTENSTGGGNEDNYERSTSKQTLGVSNKIFLANLPGNLQPKAIILSSLTNSLKRLTQEPRTKFLPVLLNEKGEPVVGKDGNPFILGNGGKSFFTSFNTDHGLALDGIYCSLTDRTGALWFGTLGGGASRYDGKSFTNFTMTHGLVNNSVMGMVEDDAGNIWFATAGGGVSKYDGKIFTSFTKADGLPSNEVWSVAKDKKGQLWFGTVNGGVSCFNGRSFINYDTTKGLPHNGVLGIREDSRGNLWFATLGGGVSCYNGRSFANFNMAQGLSANTVFGIAEDKSGNLWFATRHGATRYDGKLFTSFTTFDGLANNAVMCVKAGRNGEVWFGTNGGGVSRYDGKSFYNYTSGQGLSNNSVFSIEEDKAGNFWFGTNGGGVSRFSDNAFTSFTTTEGLTNNKVTCIAEDKNGQLWFGTNGGGVCRFDNKSFTGFTMEQGLPNNSINSVLEDRNGKLWFGTNGGGVSCYDGKSFTTFTVTEGLANNTVRCNIEDRAGNLWFGTYGGVSRFDGKSITNFSSAQGLADDIVNSIAEDKKGNLWFGTNGGVSCYDGNSISTYTALNGLRKNKINCIEVDNDGHLWFGSFGGGVIRFDGKTFSNFTSSEGLADNIVYDIIQDQRGNIVIATNLGFTLIPAKAIARPFAEIKPVLEYYNNANGYPVKDANGPNAIFCDSDGMIWAGTGSEKTALIRFDYDALKKVNDIPNLHVSAVRISEQDISWSNLAYNKTTTDSIQKSSIIIEELTTSGRELTEFERENIRRRFGKISFDSITPFYPVPVNLVLPYRHNNVSFEFNAIETGRPHFVNYQYMLEGYDKDWSPVLRKTNANFGNIPEGHYTFKVKAQSQNGGWSEPLSYSFKVLPPLHRTWWAYAIYVALAIFLLWRLHLFQKSRTIRKEREKAKERELIHAREIQKAYEELQATQSQLIHSEKMASLGVLTAGIAHEIQNPLNFVNNFAEINEELLDELKLGPLSRLEEPERKQADEIVNNLIQNLQKITLHGKRADSIVKGMLQHSRSGKNEKEPTEINKLAGEYLRLAYHGLRAKDKTFNAIMKTDFDESIGSISVISQDIGRVILNLINNAFYAVDEKTKSNPANYEPMVTLSTRRVKPTAAGLVKWVEVSVTDNGNGISQKLMDKIFQPFFTTKPTGQGTGLGLSLSYDIVKAHGGKLKVVTEEGKGSEFIIQLPEV